MVWWIHTIIADNNVDDDDGDDGDDDGDDVDDDDGDVNNCHGIVLVAGREIGPRKKRRAVRGNTTTHQ